MFILNYFSSNFIEYYIKEKQEITINIKLLNQIIRRMKNHSVVTFEFNDNFKVIIKNPLSATTFKIPFIENDTETEKEPNLTYKNKTTINSKLINKIIKDLDSHFTYFELFKEEFNIYTIDEYENKANEQTLINSEDIVIKNSYMYENVKSKYNTGLLKDSIKPQISGDITLRFMKDYPLSITYKNDKFSFEIILCPNIENE